MSSNNDTSQHKSVCKCGILQIMSSNNDTSQHELVCKKKYGQ
ncbi:MAG: hypothetical protein RR374_02300 [Clostridia bacterium]